MSKKEPKKFETDMNEISGNKVSDQVTDAILFEQDIFNGLTNMRLGQRIVLKSNDYRIGVIRVIGGWIYTVPMEQSLFIPYADCEFINLNGKDAK